jgi:hypothetical protein
MTPEAVRECFRLTLGSRKPNELIAISLETSSPVVSDSVALISGLWQVERAVDGKTTATLQRPLHPSSDDDLIPVALPSTPRSANITDPLLAWGIGDELSGDFYVLTIAQAATGISENARYTSPRRFSE